MSIRTNNNFGSSVTLASLSPSQGTSQECATQRQRARTDTTANRSDTGTSSPVGATTLKTSFCNAGYLPLTLSVYEVAPLIGKGDRSKPAQRVAVSRFLRANHINRVPGTGGYPRAKVLQAVETVDS